MRFGIKIPDEPIAVTIWMKTYFRECEAAGDYLIFRSFHRHLDFFGLKVRQNAKRIFFIVDKSKVLAIDRLNRFKDYIKRTTTVGMSVCRYLVGDACQHCAVALSAPTETLPDLHELVFLVARNFLCSVFSGNGMVQRLPAGRCSVVVN